nr:nucleotide pyrophosphatase/phosphodiesterase family protein [uncultured Actinoplanes sp.]
MSDAAPHRPTTAIPDDRLSGDAFDVVRPAYGGGSLADLLPSLSAVLGVPGAADVLGLAAHLDGAERIGVLLVDGLGAYQIGLASAFAPVLADLAAGSGGYAGTLTSGFPSTTPVSLVTLGTGAPPGAHGVLGFTVRRPDGRVLNHIFWADDPDPMVWQPVPTRFSAAATSGVAVTAVTRPEFEGSGLTVSANRGAAFVAASAGPEIAERMLTALSGTGPALVYGYFRDLDRAGHEDGVNSAGWQAAARDVDDLLDRLVHGLPDRSALLVVADHGQINIPPDARFDMVDIPDLSIGVAGVAGEPRVRYLHCVDGARDDVMATWSGVLQDNAWVRTGDQVIDEGWFGDMTAEHRQRVGDVVVICRRRAIALATGWEPPAVRKLIAHHGSLTAAEMTVPLLIAR